MTAIAPPAPDPIATEAIIAAIGLDPLIRHTLRTVTQAQMERAQGIAAEIDRKLYRFINREEREAVAELPPFDFDEVTAALDAEVLPGHKEKLMEAFGAMDEGLAVSVKVDGLREHLKLMIPRRVHEALSGPEHVPPALSELYRFRRLWNIARDPLSILDDLNEYALSRDQVQAVADLYPTIFGLFWPAVQAALVRKKTASPSWQISRQKELLLRIFAQQEDEKSLVLGRVMQELYAQEAAAAQPKPPSKPKKVTGSSNEATAAQRIDQI